jgi:hypothetical protein
MAVMKGMMLEMLAAEERNPGGVFDELSSKPTAWDTRLSLRNFAEPIGSKSRNQAG